jgi:beta-xylosidase
MFTAHAIAQPPRSPAPWIADLGNGSYKNPVLFADYSDPDVIRVGSDFYLTASSFSMIPGLPILQSRDLVNWKIINHAIDRMPPRFDTPQSGNGIWAPSIRHHDGWFWIFVGDPDWGILMTKTRDPAGKWEPIHVVQEGKGLIDTCPLWDDDGKAYLVHAFANSRAGRRDIIVVREMSPDGTRLIGEEHLVIDGRNNVFPTIEGPKFYKRNGWYYIFAPAGGVTRGYQIVARSRNVFGPYETKKVLEQGSTDVNGPHQGGWVTTQGPSTGLGPGEDWFMHFQDRGGYGRIVHLQPMRWVDDWPVMGFDKDGNGVGEPVPTFSKPNVGMSYPADVPQTSDEFTGTQIGLQWQWTANPRPEWASLIARPGWLRMHATARPQYLSQIPSQLLQKFPAPKFTATTRMELSAESVTEAGLIVMGPSYAALVVSRGADGLQVRRITSGTPGRGGSATQPDQPGESAAGLSCPLWLRVTVEPEAQCTFSYSTDGENFKSLGEAFPARGAGGTWMGSRVGLFCIGEGGHADFDWFRIEG